MTTMTTNRNNQKPKRYHNLMFNERFIIIDKNRNSLILIILSICCPYVLNLIM